MRPLPMKPVHGLKPTFLPPPENRPGPQKEKRFVFQQHAFSGATVDGKDPPPDLYETL